MEKDILLIDGNSMLFRAYYATLYSGARMSTKNGIATNAIYGFVMMINKAIEKIDPSYIAVAWDSGKPTFRHEMYDEYKGTRKELDPELKVQFPIAREFLDSYGIYRYEEDGIEADDIIGSLSKKYPDMKVHILSSDNDLLQLIDDTTDVLLMKKGITDLKVMDEKALLEEKGVSPKQIIDLKGLMGDSSDNIPGVAGIGPKTAVKLLEQYNTVEGVYQHIDELKGKMKEKLVNDKEKAFLSKTLATIKTDCTIEAGLKDFEYKCDSEKLNAFFSKYEMYSLIDKTVKTEKEKKALIKLKIVEKLDSSMLSDEMLIVVDHDNSLYYDSELFGLAVASEKGIFYLEKDNLLDDGLLNKMLTDDNTLRYGFDVKMIYHLLHRYGIGFKQFSEDLQIAAFLIDNTTNNLNKLNLAYDLDLDLDKSKIYGKANQQILIDNQQRLEYIERQANALMEIKPVLNKKLEEHKQLELLKTIEMPVAYILYEMEENGITTSIDVLREIQEKTNEILSDLEKQIYALVEEPFNINSPKQLSEVLFDKLGLHHGKKRSTAIDVLEKLSGSHPIIPLIIEYRKYQKINSTYAEGLQKHILADNKIHTTFNQCLTQTGRLSSSDPNLQNISVRDEEAREVRKAFVASPGNILYAADYSQIELRVLAHMADETNMIDAFKEGIDIHTRTAMAIFDVNKADVTALMRRQAKTVNFGMVYGQTAFGLANELGISNFEAKRFMDQYFESYPKIKSFMDETIDYCEKNGYVETMFSRRRYINEIHDKNYMTKEFGKRAAMNAPIQGTAADLIKLAMIKVDSAMKEHNAKSKMILQIHDELVFDVVPEEKDMIEKLVQDAMTKVKELKVPLIADGKFAYNYYDCK